VKELLREVFTDTLAQLEQRLREATPRGLGAAVRHAGAGGRVVLLAFGKAARNMAASVLPHLPAARTRGLLVPPATDAARLDPFEVIPGGHPLPTAGSFRAAARALELCRGASADDHVVFLISGGGSSLLEQPLDGAATVDAWRAFYLALVGCGARIDRVNAIRRRLSDVKGGRLALAAAAAAGQTTMLVRDVAGPLEDVASGPTGDFDGAPDTLRADLAEFGLLDALPEPLRTRVERGEVPRLQGLPSRVASHAAWITVLDESDARRFAMARLARADVVVDADGTTDDLPVERAAELLLQRLHELREQHAGRVALVATGELSVPLPANPGTGGRNQQFVLACAQRIAGQPITVLSAGTDGVDGNSPAAGALADGHTMVRARAAGFDVHDALRRCDAFPLLHALGDTIVTGPTGTNVRDLRVLVHHG
jgi:hydroxypyruvate reductase